MSRVGSGGSTQGHGNSRDRADRNQKGTEQGRHCSSDRRVEKDRAGHLSPGRSPFFPATGVGLRVEGRSPEP